MLKEFEKKEAMSKRIPLLITTVYIVIATLVLKTYYDMVTGPKKMKIYQLNHGRLALTVFAFILFFVCAVSLIEPIYSFASHRMRTSCVRIVKNGTQFQLSRDWNLNYDGSQFTIQMDETSYPISKEQAIDFSKDKTKQVLVYDSKQDILIKLT